MSVIHVLLETSQAEVVLTSDCHWTFARLEADATLGVLHVHLDPLLKTRYTF